MVLSKGELALALRASCSIPGIFTPTPVDDKLLIDGGILDSVPGNIAYDMGARFIVGVNLNADRSLFKLPKTGPDTVFTALKIIMNHNTRVGLQNANVVIEPDLKRIAHYDIRKLDELVELGEQAARQRIKYIKRRVKT
ncbi:MAG: patatin-like phospholipase family protein [candidate division KSB1 bacterium]|nr:patatin-like phospholipase family protein [candidate division KSB1 bacterium]